MQWRFLLSTTAAERSFQFVVGQWSYFHLMHHSWLNIFRFWYISFGPFQQFTVSLARDDLSTNIRWGFRLNVVVGITLWALLYSLFKHFVLYVFYFTIFAAFSLFCEVFFIVFFDFYFLCVFYLFFFLNRPFRIGWLLVLDPLQKILARAGRPTA